MRTQFRRRSITVEEGGAVLAALPNAAVGSASVPLASAFPRTLRSTCTRSDNSMRLAFPWKATSVGHCIPWLAMAQPKACFRHLSIPDGAGAWKDVWPWKSAASRQATLLDLEVARPSLIQRCGPESWRRFPHSHMELLRWHKAIAELRPKSPVCIVVDCGHMVGPKGTPCPTSQES